MAKINDPKLREEMKKLAELKFQIAKVKNHLTGLKTKSNAIEDSLSSILDELKATDDKIVEIGEYIIQIDRFQGERPSVQYKPLYQLAKSKVNGTIKKILEDAEEAATSISKVRASMSVRKDDKKTKSNEMIVIEALIDNIIAKAKIYLGRIFNKIKGHNKILDITIMALKKMAANK